MAYSGLKGAILNVNVNLKYIEDSVFAGERSREITALEERGEGLLNGIIGRIESCISR